MKRRMRRVALLFAGCLMISGGRTQEILASQKAAQSPAAGISAVFAEIMAENEERGEKTEVKQKEWLKSMPEKIERSEFADIAVAQVNNYVNVRREPNTESEVLGKLYDDSAAKVLETTEDGWYRIESGSVNGYVKAEYILTGTAAEEKAMEVAELMAIANTDVVNVRTEPNTDSTIWTQILNSERYLVASQQDGWVGIELDDMTAYISSDYVDVKYGLNEAIKYTPVVEEAAKPQQTKPSGGSSGSSKPKPGSSSGGNKTNDGAAGSQAGGVSSKRAQIANYAVQFIGNPYVWGGTSLTNGADCSGFTMSIMAQFGISLPHSSAAQANCGRSITSSQMRPGDLIFYANSSGTINHVAMYIGNGQIVHASSERTGIKISNAFYRTPVCVVRLLD